MSARAAFTQRDIAKAVRGAIQGGLDPERFSIVVSAKTGELRILPVAALPSQGDDDLDPELAAWRASNGLG